MRPVREILQLRYEGGTSVRAIAVAVGVTRSTVQLCLARVMVVGLTWPLPATLTDGGLEALLFASE
jgi:transposase